MTTQVSHGLPEMLCKNHAEFAAAVNMQSAGRHKCPTLQMMLQSGAGTIDTSDWPSVNCSSMRGSISLKVAAIPLYTPAPGINSGRVNLRNEDCKSKGSMNEHAQYAVASSCAGGQSCA